MNRIIREKYNQDIKAHPLNDDNVCNAIALIQNEENISDSDVTEPLTCVEEVKLRDLHLQYLKKIHHNNKIMLHTVHNLTNIKTSERNARIEISDNQIVIHKTPDKVYEVTENFDKINISFTENEGINKSNGDGENQKVDIAKEEDANAENEKEKSKKLMEIAFAYSKQNVDMLKAKEEAQRLKQQELTETVNSEQDPNLQNYINNAYECAENSQNVSVVQNYYNTRPPNMQQVEVKQNFFANTHTRPVNFQQVKVAQNFFDRPVTPQVPVAPNLFNNTNTRPVTQQVPVAPNLFNNTNTRPGRCNQVPHNIFNNNNMRPGHHMTNSMYRQHPYNMRQV